MELHETIAAIDAAVLEVLEGALEDIFPATEADGEALVLQGQQQSVEDLARRALWYLPEDAQISHAGAAIAEEWVYPVTILAFVASDRPGEGRASAQAAAARASAAVIRARGRSSGSALSTHVSGVIRSRYLPGGDPAVQAEGLQEAGFQLELRFRHREE